MALFEDIGKKMSKMAQTTVQKSKEIAETTKLNMSISSEEDKIKKIFHEIGELYFKEYSDNAPEALATLCAKVQASLKTIENIKEKINVAKNIIHCPTCGMELARTVKFCNGCGGKIEKPEAVENESEASEPEKKSCVQCNAILDEDAAFCNECGTKC